MKTTFWAEVEMDDDDHLKKGSKILKSSHFDSFKHGNFNVISVLRCPSFCIQFFFYELLNQSIHLIKQTHDDDDGWECI